MSPTSTATRACTYRRIPGGLRRWPSAKRICAGHKLAADGCYDRLTHCVLDTPTGYTKEGLRPRFRRSEALSRTWWQVKDSNLRSFRDGFTDQRRQTRDQRQYLSPV